jgi:hypothetical protein
LFITECRWTISITVTVSSVSVDGPTS